MSKEWKMVRLGDVLKRQSKSTIKAGCGEKIGKYKFFTSSSEQTKYIDICTYNQEAIILGTGGNANIHYCNEPFATSTDCFVYFAQDNVSVEAIYRYLSGNIHILQDGFKGAGLKHISKNYIEDIMLPLPSIEKQKEIAAVLDKASELVEKRKSQLTELDSLAESVFYDMFGDPVSNEKGWTKKKLNTLGKIITGNTPSRQIDSFYNEDYIEWVKTNNITDGVIYPTLAKEYLSKEGLSKGRSVAKNSLLITCIAGSIKSIGTSCLTDRTVAFNQQINAFTPNIDLCNHLFMWYLIRLIKQYIQDSATKGMKRIITKSVLEKLVFITPPLPLQQQFAQRVEKIEEQKQKVKAALKESEDLFQRLMQDMFNH